jgi:hypothetical protein
MHDPLTAARAASGATDQCTVILGSEADGSDAASSAAPGSLAAAIDGSTVIQMPCTECRICLSGDAEEDMIQPCSCSGSVSSTHLACLELWVAERCSNSCELCGQPYRAQFAPKLQEAVAAATAAKGGSFARGGSGSTGTADPQEGQQDTETRGGCAKRRFTTAWVCC